MVSSISSFAKTSKDSERIINLWMSGDGGSLDTAFLFYDIATLWWLKYESPVVINTFGSGTLCLPNIVVFLSGKKRLITPNTVFSLGRSDRSTGVGFSPEDNRLRSFLEERCASLLSTVSGKSVDFLGIIYKKPYLFL